MSVINTNIQAIAAARNLNRSQEMLGRSLNRLSSGSKIVNPSDDAAGLAVSEKLDAQNLRVQAATTNVQNAISYVQTTDGFMGGMTKILSRMSELAILAKDVTKNTSDIALYGQEFKALQEQLRQTIGGTTAQIGGTAIDTPLGQFNGIKLFGSDVDPTLPTITGIAADDGTITGGATFSRGTNVYLAGEQNGAVAGGNYADPTLDNPGTFPTIGDGVSLGSNSIVNSGATLGDNALIGSNVTIGAGAYIAPGTIIGDGVTIDPGVRISTTTPIPPGTHVTADILPSTTGLSVSVGQAVGQTMSIPQINLRDGAMGGIIKQDSGGNYVLSLTDSNATAAITDAIQDVANERASLGASQSRLELASSTLQVEFENLSSAISRIRDVDVADESTQFAKYNILVQSGTAMLAQANQTPQSVLKLLQG
ncbi:MAG TPA: flagellin [Opitutaceae bacterium]|nr:flagellin [Opitutaceae bacterium]